MISQASAAISCAPSDYGFLRFVGEHPFFVFFCLFVVCCCIENVAKHLRGSKP